MGPGDEAVGDLAPVGTELDRRHDEDEQTEAEIAEESFDPFERQNPTNDDEAYHRERDQESIGEAGEKLEADGDAPDLGRARHEVDDLGGDQGRQSRAEAGALSNQV